MTTPFHVLQFLRDAAVINMSCAIIILTDVLGASSRAPGTMMAVSADGRWCGSLSSGCVEAALVGEAQRVMASGKAERLRIGAGSPLIDIRLPCGGGMDLLIIPDPIAQDVSFAVDQLQGRQSVAIMIDANGGFAVQNATANCTTEWRGANFIIRCNPTLHLLIAGQGEELRALSALGLAYGALVSAWTPNADQAAQLAQTGVQTIWLKSAASPPDMALDRYTAFISLFHDHEWEAPLIAKALQSNAFYVGAMGSRNTHANRLQILRNAGTAAADLNRIIGPVGLLPASRDPALLALSVLAQIAEFYRKG